MWLGDGLTPPPSLAPILALASLWPAWGAREGLTLLLRIRQDPLFQREPHPQPGLWL